MRRNLGALFLSFRGIAFLPASKNMYQGGVWLRQRKVILDWCRKGAQKGDRVAVLMGSETPFILRKRSAGRFVVIGETYMHRIIGGEVIEAWKIGRIENGKIALHQQVFAGSFKECS